MLNKTDTLSPWREMESVVYSWVYYGFLFLLFLCFYECFSSFEAHFFNFHSFWLFSYTVFKRFYTINHLIYWRFNLFGRLLISVTTAALYCYVYFSSFQLYSMHAALHYQKFTLKKKQIWKTVCYVLSKIHEL